VLTNKQAVVEERTVDVHICSLRRKLKSPTLIETVRRVGYRFQERSQATGQASGSRPCLLGR
jgi:DNA-binding response OmpR family regulator